MKLRRSAETGFTLVELVVAIGVMVVLSLMSYRAIGVLIATRDHATSEQLRWRMLTSFVQRLDLDLQQLATSVPGALEFDPAQASLRIVRFARSTQGDDVKTVYYRWQSGVIERFERRGFGPRGLVPVADGEAVEQLLPDVSFVEWQWPAVPVAKNSPIVWQLPPASQNLLVPPALKLTLRLGEPRMDVVRIFALK